MRCDLVWLFDEVPGVGEKKMLVLLGGWRACPEGNSSIDRVVKAEKDLRRKKGGQKADETQASYMCSVSVGLVWPN